jgi:molecular chaperone HtpG
MPMWWKSSSTRMKMPSKLSDDQKENSKEIIEKQLEKQIFPCCFENMSETDQPMLITQPEFMRRMKDMSALGGGMGYMGSMPDTYNLVVNTNHPTVYRKIDEADAGQTHQPVDRPGHAFKKLAER